MRKTVVLSVAFATILAAFVAAFGQDPAPQQPTAEDLAKEKEVLEKNAYRLLDQVIDEAQSLRLPENRVRVQINAADLLWDRNQSRARSLFSLASDGVVEMMRSSNAVNQRGMPNQDRRSFSLRQELVLAAARHDAQLAYQLLAATKSQTPPAQTADVRNPRMQVDLDDNLEQTLLGRVAALDPKLAAQNAEQMMEKGQFPRSLGEVINQLQRQDADAAAKLAEKTVRRIQSANLLSNNEAGNLAQMLLSPGPRLPAPANSSSTTETKAPQSSSRGPVLDSSLYTDLLTSVVDSALKATPQTQNTQRDQQRPGAGRGRNFQQQYNQPAQPTDAQIEQNNARRLLAGLQQRLPIIDQYLPGRANAVRQKLTELGLDSRANFGQAMGALQQSKPSADLLVQAAATAPGPMQTRIYQQAAVRAMEEGNTDQARQIANDHLQAAQRDSIIQRIEFRELAKKSEGARLDEIRQNVARLSTDAEKVSLLLQIANDLQKDNPKAQLQLLEEARQVVNHRATSYDQFEDQLRVARAFAAVDPARSFEVLEGGIAQLNELLSAAAVLSGFEVNIFRDGEMTVNQGGGSGLNSTISRYGQELASLAKTDFERSESLAGRFQFTEARIMTRIWIIKGVLGVQSSIPNVTFTRTAGAVNFSLPN